MAIGPQAVLLAMLGIQTAAVVLPVVIELVQKFPPDRYPYLYGPVGIGYKIVQEKLQQKGMQPIGHEQFQEIIAILSRIDYKQLQQIATTVAQMK